MVLIMKKIILFVIVWNLVSPDTFHKGSIYEHICMDGYAFNRLHVRLMIRPPGTYKNSAVILILSFQITKSTKASLFSPSSLARLLRSRRLCELKRMRSFCFLRVPLFFLWSDHLTVETVKLGNFHSQLWMI